MSSRVDECGCRDDRRDAVGSGGVLAFLLLAMALPAAAQVVPPGGYANRPLAAVLQAFQARGLRIVFASNIVTPDMRVRAEPHAGDLRRQLDEILAPHRLVAREGAGGTLQIVRAPAMSDVPAVRTPSAKPSEGEGKRPSPAPLRTYDEWITVISAPRPAPSGAPEETANHRDLISMPAGLVDDPLQAINSMPRVAPIGDYRSEFVVRASPFRHAEVVVDGVSTSWLRHSPVSSASVSMFTSQLVESATLRAGAYPRVYGDRLGPQLELTLREGARDHAQVHGTVGTTAAAFIAEGPLGKERGSWIVAVRQSFLEWPGEHPHSTQPVFGFSDALGKLVLDVGSRHRLGLTLLTGTSRVDWDEDVATEPMTEPVSRTTVLNMSWRSAVGSNTVISHRAYLIESAAQGTDREVVYRPTLARAMPGGVFEIGAQLGRTSWSRGGQAPTAAWTRSGYISVRSQVAERLTIAPGIRVSAASHAAGPAVTPWIGAELPVAERWTIAASTGLSHQFPDAAHAYATASADRLQPERAAHLDVSLRQQLTAEVRWQATLYQRRERRIIDGDESRLVGSARGLEIVLERQSASGLSGWAAYSYGWARQTDLGLGETFWADFDQRHAITAFGAYRWPESTSVGATVRVGSGVPIPGYLSSRGNDLFIGERRNDVRLSRYVRIDLRADRALRLGGPRVHGFVEVVNVLNRSNTGASRGTLAPSGEAIGFIERLSPRRASAGVTVGF